MTTPILRGFLVLTLIAGLGTLPSSPSRAAESAEQRQERIALGFVERVASGDVEATVDYIRANFGTELLERRPPESWERLAQQLGRHAGLEVAGIFIDEPGHLVIEAESPVGMMIEFGFDFSPDEPDKIAGLSLQAGGGERGGPKLPPFELPDDASSEQIAEALDAYLGSLGRDGVFSGAALVARHGEPIYTGAWGLASREWEAPNRIDTRFDLGSINKSFTRIAIGQLVLAGELSLDDRIADHLPGYPNADVAVKVTIRHLLDHSSGIGDIFNDRFFHSAKRLYREPEDFFPVFADQPLAFEPGTGSAYSNGGFMVLGAIIAAASGQTYSEYVAEHIFAPAGMDSTGFFARDEPVPNVAIGYTHMGPDGRTDELHNNLFRLPVRGNSAGSAFSTVGDLLAFDNALREHRLLAPAWTHWYFGGAEPGTENPEAPSGRSTAATGIAGGAPGVSAVLESDGVVTIIVLSNYDEPGAETVGRALRRPLTRALR